MSRFYRGSAPSLKPEGAIKRADELLSVGQKQAALQTLHDTITNKRQQRNWTKALEQVGIEKERCFGLDAPSVDAHQQQTAGSMYAIAHRPISCPLPFAGHVQVH
jgi:hypothetical protein